MSWVDLLLERLRADPTPRLDAGQLALVLVIPLVAVLVEPLWRVLRLAVTLVHELGHAFVGVLTGRRFTGFVLRGDASGHAVTVGRARGPGRVATTWAGYPAPAAVAVSIVAATTRGLAGALLAATVVLLAVALPRVRSALTLLVLLTATAGVAALWWWGSATLQAEVLLGLALVLLIGGWRHVAAVARAGRRAGQSDPAVLAQLTGIPWVAWLLTFWVVLAGGSYLIARMLLPLAGVTLP